MAVAVEGAVQIRVRGVGRIHNPCGREEVLRAYDLAIAEPIRSTEIGCAGAFVSQQRSVRLDRIVGEAGVLRVDSGVDDADHNAFTRVGDPAGRVPCSVGKLRKSHVVRRMGCADGYHFVLHDSPYRVVALQQRNLKSTSSATKLGLPYSRPRG